MVIVRALLYLCSFILSLSLQQPQLNLPAKVTVEIPSQGAFENQAIPIAIKIIRLREQTVDTSSFTLGERRIQVISKGDQLAKDSVVVSTYEFTLPPQPRGLYVLPPVSVIVGGVKVSSPSISYEVVGSYLSQGLMLEARAVPPGPVYPGQKVTFEYRISFQQAIQLTKEEMPLLDFPGFRNIGAPKIVNVPSGNLTAQIISQEAVAVTTGMYRSGTSFLEGYVYTIDFSGNRVSVPPLLRAQAPEIAMEVLPFPTSGRPVGFNGAVGIFHWQIKLLGSSTVQAGEKVQLEVLVTGQGDFDSVVLPDLSLQKGFKDNFLLSDIAPLGEKQDGRLRFVVDLRPIRPQVKEIPSIEFASFDSNSGTYVVENSKPIPITIIPSHTAKKAEKAQPARQVSDIEIQGNVQLADTKSARHLDAILIVYAVVTLLFIYGLQFIMRRLMKESTEKSGMSRELFMKAIKSRNTTEDCYRLLREALLLALFEAQITNEIVTHPEQLSQEGLQGEVRAFLTSIEQKRFSGIETQVDINDSINQATLLYHRLKK